MPIQIISLKLDGITAGDYLTWCRDPEPHALDFALRSITIDADPLQDTITAILDWNGSAPEPSTAAGAAGLPLSAGVQIMNSPARQVSRRGTRRLTCIPAGAGTARVDRGRSSAESTEELRAAI
jgi:hypothetical protein